MADDDLELVYLTLDDALELYAAITDSTTAHATAVLRARSTLEGALARPATYAHYHDADISLRQPSSRTASPKAKCFSTATSASPSSRC